MAKQFRASVLFRYFFLYCLLGFSAVLAFWGRLDASGAVLGGSVALFSLQKSEDELDPEAEEAIDELQQRVLEAHHEIEYYKYKLIESDLRTRYQGVVNQNLLEINNLKLEKNGFAETVTQEQIENSSKSQKISLLESENNRLKEQISKMEKDRILTMKRSPIKSADVRAIDAVESPEDSTVAMMDS